MANERTKAEARTTTTGAEARDAPRRVKKKPEEVTTVGAYVQQRTKGWMKDVAVRLTDLVAEVAPEAVGEIRWGQPVWDFHGPMLWLRAGKNHLSFGFWHGAELNDSNGLLTGDGTKMRHVKLTSAEGLDVAALAGLIEQAMKINQKHP